MGTALSDAAKGAGLGATLGTVVPGVGNVVGGAIGGIGGLLSGVFGGLGGGSGSDPTKNALREQQLQEAEQQAMGGNPAAIAELQSWNRPGPTNAQAQQFVSSQLAGIPSQAGSFSGNYGQFDAGGGGAGSALGGALSPSGAGGSPLGGILGTAGQTVAALQGAQNYASQQAQLNASRAAAQNSYAQKAGIRGQALAGLSNAMQAPNLSSDFAGSSNPFARNGATPFSGMSSTQGAPVLYAGNAKSPAAFNGPPIGTPPAQAALGGIANATVRPPAAMGAV